MTHPETMKALVLPAYDADLEAAIRSLRVEERPVPKPGPGEVLVKMLAAPCNPSDTLFMQRRYGVEKTLPAIPGWEGCGEVVASGGGAKPWFLQGQRVACGAQGDFDGTWAEYYVVSADNCVPLVGGMDPAQGAMLLVNPLTAVALIDVARSRGATAAVHLAAASALGRLMLKIAKQEGFPLIHVVRRDEQVELLRGLGAEHVLNSSEEGYLERLEALSAKLGARVALDPIGGAATGEVLKVLPRGGEVVVYGALSEEDCAGIDPIELIFRGKRVSGFWLTEWVERQGLPGLFYKTYQLQQAFLRKELSSEVRAEVGFEDFPAALLEYVGEMTAGKVVLRPGD